MPLICQHTDGGRSFSRKRKKQRNDCTVVAYATALDLTYDQAYETLANAGRKSGRGFAMAQFIENRWYNRKRFQTIHTIETQLMSVFELMESGIVAKGSYIVGVKRHVFAIKDGVIHDMHLMYVRGNFPQILNIWKVMPYENKYLNMKLKLMNDPNWVPYKPKKELVNA